MRWWSVGVVVVYAAGCAQILSFDDDYGYAEPPSDTSAGVGSVGTGTLAGSATSTSNTGTGGMAQGGASPVAATSSSSSGGAGGAGMTYTWDAQTATINPDGTFTLPYWLAFTSPSSGKTSQTGSSSLRTGFGVDAPRARRVTDKQTDWGLSIESERTNVVHGSDSWDNYWQYPTTPMAFFPMQADPAGGMAAALFSSTGDQESHYFTATGRTVSAWLLGMGFIGDPDPPGGPMSFAHFRHADAINTPYVEVDTMIWTRYSFTNTMNTTGNLALSTRDSPAGAGAILSATNVLAYGAQIEPDHAYPSSYIPNSTLGSVTRQAETLSSPLTSTLLPGGFFRIELRFAPNYASGEQSGDHMLIFFGDVDNHLFVRKSDNAIVLRTNGSDLASSSLQWNREQPLTVIAAHTPAGRTLTVMGAGNGDGTVNQGAAPPVQVGATLYVLGNSMGAQECADLRYISFAPP